MKPWDSRGRILIRVLTSLRIKDIRFVDPPKSSDGRDELLARAPSGWGIASVTGRRVADSCRLAGGHCIRPRCDTLTGINGPARYLVDSIYVG